MPSVLIVVLNWNGLEDTIKCVSSLLKMTYENYHILVVDNGSAIKPTASDFSNNPNVSIHMNTTNLGFSGGVNTGINIALSSNYEYVALINNDATVDRNWLSYLVAASAEKNADICAGLLLDSTGKHIDSAGEYYSSWGVSFPNNRNLPVSKASKSGYIFGATGGAALYRSRVFRTVGYFDETFFAYYEDADINFRSQLAGYKAYYTSNAIAYHKRGAASNKVPGFTVYQMFKNIPLLFWKNMPAQLIFSVGLRFIVLYIAMFSKAVFSGGGWYALKGMTASIWFFWTKSLWQRFTVQSTRKVDAKYIWSILYKDLPPEQTGMRSVRKFFTGV